MSWNACVEGLPAAQEGWQSGMTTFKIRLNTTRTTHCRKPRKSSSARAIACLCRARKMMQLAMKSIPLRHDDAPLEVRFGPLSFSGSYAHLHHPIRCQILHCSVVWYALCAAAA